MTMLWVLISKKKILYEAQITVMTYYRNKHKGIALKPGNVP